MPDNRAAWLTAASPTLEVGPADYTPPCADEIVVRNRAVAINPVDWMLPIIGAMMFPWIKRPAVLGADVAGEVVEVGAAVTRFKVGDRVLGMALGTSKARTRPAEGAFQLYTVLVEHMVCPIPADMSFERASVLPLTLSTAACGLFQKDQLALNPPSASPKPTGKTLLVWGGSTSVGSNAIQLAVAAGYEVFTTASPHNFDYVRGLGASRAFDYRSKTVVADIVAALRGKTIAGAMAIGQGSANPCLDIIHASTGDKFLSTASPPGDFKPPAGGRLTPRAMLGFGAAAVSQAVKARMRGIRTKFIFGDSLANNEVGPMIYVDFLPSALAEGRYRAAPDPEVVGHGVESIQAGFDVQRAGVSARKVVVTL